MARDLTISHDALEAWAGRSLTDEEVSLIEEVLHNSSVPDAVATIADNIR